MNQITIEDFIYHMCEKSDSKIKAASSIGFLYELWDEDGFEENKSKAKEQLELFGPELDYKSCYDHSYLRLRFQNEKHPDYKRLVRLLEKYEQDYNDFLMHEERNDFPALLITILPLYYHGKYYMSCINMLMWRAFELESGAYVEMLFADDSLVVFQTDQINEMEIDTQIQREEETRLYMEEKAEEQKKYEEERKKIREGLK